MSAFERVMNDLANRGFYDIHVTNDVSDSPGGWAGYLAGNGYKQAQYFNGGHPAVGVDTNNHVMTPVGPRAPCVTKIKHHRYEACNIMNKPHNGSK